MTQALVINVPDELHASAVALALSRGVTLEALFLRAVEKDTRLAAAVRAGRETYDPEYTERARRNAQAAAEAKARRQEATAARESRRANVRKDHETMTEWVTAVEAPGNLIEMMRNPLAEMHAANFRRVPCPGR